jgi:hypothetical protein
MPLPLLGSVAAGHRTIRFLFKEACSLNSGLVFFGHQPTEM